MLPGNLNEIFELLGGKEPVALRELSKRGLQLPSSCEVLRELYDGNDLVIVPSYPFVSLLLQHSRDVAKTKLTVHKMIYEAVSRGL